MKNYTVRLRSKKYPGAMLDEELFDIQAKSLAEAKRNAKSEYHHPEDLQWVNEVFLSDNQANA